MKLIDGDKLKKHLDYLIKKDTQFAKMCEGNDDFNRQRKYCFEANILAYELCQNVMDYYLVRDIQSADTENMATVSDEFICKKCGIYLKDYIKVVMDEDNDGYIDEQHYEYEPKFCPECGAKIKDGEQNDS